MGIYQPGKEPEKIRKSIERLFEKLDSAYPDKVIIGLHKDHKKWGEKVTELYRLLGYPDGNAFLKAYGYTVEVASTGRPASIDPATVIVRLKELYPQGTDKSVDELKQANADIPWKTLQNKASEFFGMPLSKYLEQEGIILSKKKEPEVKETPEEKLDKIISVLKERYIGTDKKVFTVSYLEKANPDLPISSLQRLVKKIHNKSQVEYLVELGILQKYDEEAIASYRNERITAEKNKQLEMFRDDKPFDELVKIYSALYREGTTANPYFNIKIPESAPIKTGPEIKYREKREVLPGGFVVDHEITEKESYYELIKYTGNAEVVVVPDKVRAITGMEIFSDNNIKQVIIPAGVTKVNLTSFTAQVRKNIADKDGFCILGKYLIEYVGSEKTVKIPEGVEEITFRAFENNNLETVYLPESIKVIGNQAFSGCEKLTSIIFSEKTKTLESIEYCAFSECKSLRSINLPKNINEVDKNAFLSCDVLNSDSGFIIAGNNLLSYSGTETTVCIPEGIKVIAEAAFYRSDIIEVYIPEGVTTIRKDAFCMAKSLKKVSLSSTVTTIEKTAFYLCDNLTNINLDNVVSIGREAFGLCYKLNKVDFTEKLKEIGDSAFSYCKNLKSVFLPAGIKKLENRVFMTCSSLESVVLPEGIEEIGHESFMQTKSLERIIIPASVKKIGQNAFKGSKCSKEIKLPEQLADKKVFIGIPDENNCYVENGVLIRMEPQETNKLKVSDGVIVIGEGALYDAWQAIRIELPDTVRLIRHVNYSHSSSFRMNIPRGYLLQKSKLPTEPLINLLSTAWKYEAGMLDWVSVCIYQRNSKIKELCVETFAKAPNAFVAACIAIFSENQPSKAKDIEYITEIIFDLRKNISQEFIDKFYLFAKENKAEKAATVLNPFVSQEAGGSINAVRGYQNDVEKFCYENFEKHSIDRVLTKIKLDDKYFENSGVVYSDGGAPAPAFVLECAIVPYIGQLAEKPKKIGTYKTDYSRFVHIKNSDDIATSFEKKSFASFLEKLSEKAEGYTLPQIWLPVCRFGTGTQIKNLISKFNTWQDWHKGAAGGRSGIVVCRGAILLSDTREAILYAEKCKCLDYYASLRGTTADVIRDTRLADFGLDMNGKKTYDTGNTIIEVTLGDDLSLNLYDTNAGKIIKSIPKKGADPKKHDECAADYSELKKNIKRVVKARKDLLFECFLSGRHLNSSVWLQAYTKNPVLNRIARLLVWCQNGTTFTLCDNGAVDSKGDSYEVTTSSVITVAHPIEMDDVDISNWQKYFASNGLKQPFEQIWEAKIDENRIEKDRYKGCMIPYYRFLNQEKHGIFVEDSNFHDEIDIRFWGCQAVIMRIDWKRHEINMDDRFEITSFEVVRLNRYANHIICYLDQCTIYSRIERDDESALNNLDRYTIAQINAFLKFAIEKESIKCSAILLDYKNEHFSEFFDIDEFTLDF